MKRTVKQVVIHLASKRGIDKLLSVYGLCASLHHTRGVGGYCCCAKVNVREKSRSISGYVIEENRLLFTVILENDELATV